MISFSVLESRQKYFLAILKAEEKSPDNGTYFEIGVAVLFQAAVFAFQGQLHWQEKCRNYRE